MGTCFIGVDVGTGSARAGVFDADRPDARHRQARHHALPRAGLDRRAVERRDLGGGLRPPSAGPSPRQASRRTTCAASASTPPARWWCSGRAAPPLPVGPSEDPARDIIVWMDHRAVEQAERINAERPRRPALRRRHDLAGDGNAEASLAEGEPTPAVFDAAWQFFDLTDFLTWKATGSLARSSCTVTCKWTYLAHERRWDPGYFRAIGLGALADEGFARIGREVVDPGTAARRGLTGGRGRRRSASRRARRRRRPDRRPRRRRRHRRRRAATRRAAWATSSAPRPAR